MAKRSRTPRAAAPLDKIILPADGVRLGASVGAAPEVAVRDFTPTPRDAAHLAEIIAQEAALEAPIAVEAWEWDRAVRGLAAALEDIESVFEKYGPRVPGPLPANEADAFRLLRAEMPGFKARVGAALEQARQRRALCFYTEPNPESREDRGQAARRVLFAHAGLSVDKIAALELSAEGHPADRDSVRKRAAAVKKALLRLRRKATARARR